MIIKNKRGQLTIFIIIAVIIIAAIIIFFATTDTGKKAVNNLLGQQEIDFEQEFKNCVEANRNINNNLKLLESQGGVLAPTNYLLYNNSKIEYLCYTNEYLKTCVMQKPLLIQDIKFEIKKLSEPEIRTCMMNIKKDLESRGYNVNPGQLNFSVDIIPKGIIFSINYPITIQKQDTKRYEKFEVRKQSSIYQLIMLSTSILNYEARYGDSDPLVFMTLYPDIRVDKQKKSDGTNIYSLSDRKTGESFVFATRSVAWPAGYFGAQKA